MSPLIRIYTVCKKMFSSVYGINTLRKQTYSNILKILPPKKKNENFQIKIMILLFFLLKNTDCGYSLEPPRRGGSNEYLQSMF